MTPGMTPAVETAPLLSRPLLPRREAFCRHVAAGRSLAAAARLAGYAWHGAKQQGSRLLRDPAVAARVAELAARREARRRDEVAQLVEAARTVFLGASSRGNHAAALRSLDMMTRLLGTLGDPAALDAADDPAEDAEDDGDDAEDPGVAEPEAGGPPADMPPELPARLPALAEVPDPLAIAYDAAEMAKRRREAEDVARLAPAAATALAAAERAMRASSLMAARQSGSGGAGLGLAGLGGPGSLRDALMAEAAWGKQPRDPFDPAPRK
jgi:hypothetical protein